MEGINWQATLLFYAFGGFIVGLVVSSFLFKREKKVSLTTGTSCTTPQTTISYGCTCNYEVLDKKLESLESKLKDIVIKNNFGDYFHKEVKSLEITFKNGRKKTFVDSVMKGQTGNYLMTIIDNRKRQIMINLSDVAFYIYTTFNPEKDSPKKGYSV